MLDKEEKKEIPKGLRKFVDTKIEKDEALQALCDKKNVVLLAFIGSYIPRKYNPVSSGSATISIVDEFGMEEALKDIQNSILNIRRSFYERFIFTKRLAASSFFGFHGASPRNLCLPPFSAVAWLSSAPESIPYTPSAP